MNNVCNSDQRQELVYLLNLLVLQHSCFVYDRLGKLNMKTCNDRGSREALATPDHKLTPSPPTHLLMDCLWATLISWSSPTSDDLSTIDMAELGGLWVISCVLVITLCSDRSGGVWIWEVRGVASEVESRLTCYTVVQSLLVYSSLLVSYLVNLR